MNKLQITYFLHLCKTLNITETARQLYVAQPSVSKQISALEKELGYDLFVRTNRGLELTESGQIMYEFFEKFRIGFLSADREAKRKAEHGSDILNIGVLENLGVDELRYVIRDLQREDPQTTLNFIRLGNNALMDRLKDQRIDVAITFDHALNHSSGLCSETLVREECLFIISNSHPLAEKAELTPKDLSGELFCQSWTKEASADEYLESLIHSLGIIPRGYLTVENLASGIESIEANNTVGLIDERIQLPYPERFRIIHTGVRQEIVIAWSTENRSELIPILTERLQKRFSQT